MFNASSKRPPPRPRQDPGAEKHHFLYTHPRRAEDPAVDAVCSRCGVEQLDITPTAMKQSARWRQGRNGDLVATKPACV